LRCSYWEVLVLLLKPAPQVAEVEAPERKKARPLLKLVKQGVVMQAQRDKQGALTGEAKPGRQTKECTEAQVR
jgi:hypothetical protein